MKSRGHPEKEMWVWQRGEPRKFSREQRAGGIAEDEADMRGFEQGK